MCPAGRLFCLHGLEFFSSTLGRSPGVCGMTFSGKGCEEGVRDECIRGRLSGMRCVDCGGASRACVCMLMGTSCSGK